MSIYQAKTPSTPFDKKLYSLRLHQEDYQTKIVMNLRTDFFHTNSLPNTFDSLNALLPGVLDSKCFNDDDLPFHKEVINTEIGHLFEHILLEYLCSLKIASGAKKALFKGVTNWDWKKDVRGTYHIVLDMQPEDSRFFMEALQRTIKLFDKILITDNIN